MTKTTKHHPDPLLAFLDSPDSALDSFNRAKRQLRAVLAEVAAEPHPSKRVRLTVRRLRAVATTDLDMFCELDGLGLLRPLAERLGVPYLLLRFINAETMDDPDLTMTDVDEWLAWDGKKAAGAIADTGSVGRTRSKHAA